MTPRPRNVNVHDEPCEAIWRETVTMKDVISKLTENRRGVSAEEGASKFENVQRQSIESASLTELHERPRHRYFDKWNRSRTANIDWIGWVLSQSCNRKSVDKRLESGAVNFRRSSLRSPLATRLRYNRKKTPLHQQEFWDDGLFSSSFLPVRM